MMMMMMMMMMMIDQYGEVAGKRIGRRDRSTGTKPPIHFVHLLDSL
jgi:hypothetical protein